MNAEQEMRVAALAAAVALNGQQAHPGKLPDVMRRAEQLLDWIDDGTPPSLMPGEMW